MWKANHDHAERRMFKKFAKAHPDEFASCFKNLETLRSRLNAGYDFPAECVFGFVHVESNNLIGIGQKHTSSSLETRLYTYVSKSEKILYVLSIGGKATQQADINRLCNYIDKYL